MNEKLKKILKSDTVGCVGPVSREETVYLYAGKCNTHVLYSK
jgi:hypothetical protein